MLTLLKLNVLFACLVSAILWIHIWPHRRASSAKWLLANLTTYFLWSFWVIATLLADDFEAKIFFTKVRQLANPFIGPIWACLVISIFCRNFWDRWAKYLFVLWLLPLATSICTLLSVMGVESAENLVAHGFTPMAAGLGLLDYRVGPLLKTLFTYTIVVMVSLQVLYIISLFSKDQRRRRYAVIFLLATVIVMPFEIAAQISKNSLYIQLMAGGSWVIVAFLYYGITRYEFFDFKPKAHHQIFDSLPSPVIALTPEGRLWEINAEARKVFGLSDSKLGQSLPRSLSAGLRADSRVLNVSGRTYQIFKYEFPLGSRSEDGLIFVLGDVTEISESNQTLKALHTEILQMTHFNQKVQTVLSHDLSGILASLRRLLAQAIDSKGTIVDLDRMYKASDASLNLLRNVLDWSQEDARMQDGAPLIEILERVRDQLSPLIDEKDLELVMPQGSLQINLAGSRHRLEAIFRNVVSNAVKFSPVGGQVLIRAGTESGLAEITVQDNGTGMSPAEIQSLLSGHGEQLKQGDGYGVGMRFTLEFVRQLLGEIEIESPLGRGTLVVLKLPIKVELKV